MRVLAVAKWRRHHSLLARVRRMKRIQKLRHRVVILHDHHIGLVFRTRIEELRLKVSIAETVSHGPHFYKRARVNHEYIAGFDSHHNCVLVREVEDIAILEIGRANRKPDAQLPTVIGSNPLDAFDQFRAGKHHSFDMDAVWQWRDVCIPLKGGNQHLLTFLYDCVEAFGSEVVQRSHRG